MHLTTRLTRSLRIRSSFPFSLLTLLLAGSLAAVVNAQTLDGVLMSGSGEGGFNTRNISFYNPDLDRLYNVSVTPHLWQSTVSNTDTLDGLVIGARHGGARTSSWNPSLSKSGRMAFVVNWFGGTEQDPFHIVAQNRDATDRVVLAGPFHSGGASTGGGPDRSYRPSVSPDGETVILADYRLTNVDGGRQTTGQLLRMPSDGSAEPVRIDINDPNGCNEVMQAVYHPDRDEIAFLGYSMFDGICTPAVRVMDADGSNLRDLYVDANHNYIGWHIGFQLIDWKADRILVAESTVGRNFTIEPRYNVLVIDDTSGEVVGSHAATADHLIRSSFQLSPDAQHLGYAMNPDGQCWITVKDLETGEKVLDLTDVADTGQYCYMNWADAPAVPEPARLELSESHLVLWNEKAVQVLPTLYDVDDNVIAHEVRRFTETVHSTQFRVNRLEHMYFGWTANSTSPQEQCFLNAGFEACFTVWNAEAPVFSIEALTDTLYEATGEPGFVRITRFGNPRGMNVEISNRHTARPFRDFLMDPPGTSLAFAEGVDERLIRITPIENGTVTNNRTVRIRLDNGTGYAVNTTVPRLVEIPIIDSGVSSTSLAVTGVAPARGGDRGTVELRAAGRGFDANAELYLERGGARIHVTDAEVETRFGQSSISGRADLREGSLGLWDVVVESGGDRQVLSGAFEIIESPAEPIIYSSVIGPRTVSMREWGHRYRVNIRNGGDTDIYDVMAYIWTHRETSAALERGLVEFDDADYDASAPVFVDRGDYQIAPIWIYRLPANESVEVTLHVVNPVELVGQDLLVGVTHSTPNPEHAFTWTGILDEDGEEALPWNLGVYLGRLAHFAEEMGAGKVACVSPPGSPPSGSGGSSQCAGFGSSVGSGNSASDPSDLVGDLQNDKARFWRAIREIPKYGAQKAVTSVPRRFTAGELVGGCVLNQAIGSVTGYRSDADFAASLGFGEGNGSGGSGGGSGGGSMCSPIVFSEDPNDKLSLSGEGEGRHLASIMELPYQIRFENVDSATAPAQIVTITDTLDLAVYDVNTFRLGAIEIADEAIAEPPFGVTSFTTTIDRRPEADHRIHIHAALERDDERNFARVVWTLTTLDPDADELPNEAMEGFLPPNKTAPEGEGSVQFYIRPHDHLPHGREISNHAEIVFDSNEPILTPVWTNTLDFMPPSSAVAAVKQAETDGVWEVEWDGSDSGAGIREFGIFVQKDGGPFELWTVSSETSALFEGDPDSEYGFFAMSIDRVGNVEGPKTEAEMSTAVSIEGPGGGLPTVFALHGNYPNPFNPSTIIPFDLPEPAHVRLQVYDVLGRQVETILDKEMEAGRHALTFEASRLASGMYLIRIDAGTFSSTRQMTLVR